MFIYNIYTEAYAEFYNGGEGLKINNYLIVTGALA
jgi:hypothetical protein